MRIKLLSTIRFNRFNLKNVKIGTRILALFLFIITAAIAIVTGVTYTIGKDNLENMITNQLDNSVRSIVNQISLLTSAYSSREFSGKLNYVLTSELASYKQAGYDTEIYLLKSDGMMVDRIDVNKDTNKKSDLSDDLLKRALKEKKGIMEIKQNGKEITVAFGYILEKDWIYAVAIKKASYLKLLYKLQFASLICGIICILMAFVLNFIGTRGIIDSISKISKTVTAAGNGLLSVRSTAARGGPEIANLSNSLNLMLMNFQKLLGEIGSSIEELTASSKELNEISKITDASTAYIFDMTRKMSENYDEQNSVAAQIAESASKLIMTIEEVTQKVNMTAELSELMIDSVGEGMKTLKELDGFMTEIDKVSEEIVDFVHVLDSRSNQISKITNTIRSISGQTKLLSLNASIEAARAGESGQGFMVVAHEIQNLAYDSSVSAIEVEDIVKDIKANMVAVLKTAEHGREISYKGTEIANITDITFSNILNKVSQTHENVQDISLKASHISEKIRQFEINSDRILSIINQMSASSQEVAAEVEKHHGISGSVIVNAENILNVAAKFEQIKKSFSTD
jgi:methyl-accepting chemotaxis protein